MNEIISTYHHRFEGGKKAISRTALAFGFGISLAALTGCGGSEGDAAPDVTPPVTREVATPGITPSATFEIATPGATPEKCNIVGLEELDFNDDACIIGPQ